MHIPRCRYFLPLMVVLGAWLALAAAPKKPVSKAPAKKPATVSAAKKSSSSTAKKPTSTKATATSSARKATTRKTTSRSRRSRRVYRQTWSAPTYADSTSGDRMEGEDLVARRAAVEALGPFNGSVVVVDPSNGRLLTVVNQKQAFQKSYLPCSTVKLVAAVGSLLEGNIDRYTTQRLSRYTYMNLTEAMARSNNPYFANLGGQLGFSKVHSYASMLGLGEPATIGVPEEKAGWLTEATPKTGIGMMTTFGDGVHQTPVQLAAMLTAFANGGTLYFLQHPKTNEEANNLLPVIKRQLNISHILDDLKAGMRGAVEFGSARRAGYAASEENIFGKTGTCTHSDGQTHLGWFGSFAEDGDRKLVVVVLLTGGRPINGPVASGIAGNFYRRYSQLRGMRADAMLPLPELTCCGN